MPTNLFAFTSSLTGSPGLNLSEGEPNLASPRARLAAVLGGSGSLEAGRWKGEKLEEPAAEPGRWTRQRSKRWRQDCSPASPRRSQARTLASGRCPTPKLEGAPPGAQPAGRVSRRVQLALPSPSPPLSIPGGLAPPRAGPAALTQPEVQAVGEAPAGLRRVEHQVGIPDVEIAIRALGHRHQLQLLNSPDLQPRPLACAGELLVVQPLGHDAGTRCSGERTWDLADLGVGLNSDRLEGPGSQRFYRVCAAGREGAGRGWSGRGPQTGGAECPGGVTRQEAILLSAASCTNLLLPLLQPEGNQNPRNCRDPEGTYWNSRKYVLPGRTFSLATDGGDQQLKLFSASLKEKKKNRLFR